MSSPIRKNSLYPEVDQSNPEANSFSSSSPSLYPSIQMKEIAENLFPDTENTNPDPQSSEEVLIRIPDTIVHLIDKKQSVQLAAGEFSVVRLRQGDNVVAVLARVGDQIQWPLAKDEAAVKLDDSHYFFSLRVPSESEPKCSDRGDEIEPDNLLNYGLTINSKGQEGNLDAFDGVLERYSLYSTERVSGEIGDGWLTVPGRRIPAEEKAAAFWTTVAPNVEDYSSSVARMIAAGSGQVIRGILWCGDLTVERLNWGNEFLRRRLGQGSKAEISPQALRRTKRVKKLTQMSENVAAGILSGVVKVSGIFTSSIVNSAIGKKFFNILPGEIVLASLDGFNKVCDAVEVAGRNVMSTSSVVTTGLVSQRYGEEAAELTNEGLDAAGHAIGTAWAVFKIRKALNPKSVIKPTTLVKAAAQSNASDLKKTKVQKQQQ